MNIARLALILLLGWLIGRWLKVYLDKPSGKVAHSGLTDMVKCPDCQTYIVKGAKHVCAGKPLAALFVLIALFTSPGIAHADAGGRYLVEVQGSHVVAGLEINGIKAERWSLGAEGVAGASLNHWLKQGSNTLTFKASTLAGGNAKIYARIYFLGVGTAGASSTVTLLDIPDLAKAQRGATVSFNLTAAPGLQLWQTTTAPDALTQAQAATMTSGLRGEVISALAVGGGLDDVAALKIEQDDLLRAFGSSATPQPLAVAPQNPQAKVEVSKAPLAAELAISPVGTTGLQRIARKDNAPLIVARQSGQVTAIPAIIVGWTDGAWHILRRAN